MPTLLEERKLFEPLPLDGIGEMRYQLASKIHKERMSGHSVKYISRQYGKSRREVNEYLRIAVAPVDDGGFGLTEKDYKWKFSEQDKIDINNLYWERTGERYAHRTVEDIRRAFEERTVKSISTSSIYRFVKGRRGKEKIDIDHGVKPVVNFFEQYVNEELPPKSAEYLDAIQTQKPLSLVPFETPHLQPEERIVEQHLESIYREMESKLPNGEILDVYHTIKNSGELPKDIASRVDMAYLLEKSEIGKYERKARTTDAVKRETNEEKLRMAEERQRYLGLGLWMGIQALQSSLDPSDIRLTQALRNTALFYAINAREIYLDDLLRIVDMPKAQPKRSLWGIITNPITRLFR